MNDNNIKFDKKTEIITRNDLDAVKQLRLATKAGSVSAAAALLQSSEQVRAMSAAAKSTKICGSTVSQFHLCSPAPGQEVQMQDPATGKTIPVLVHEKRIKDKDFSKIFLNDLIFTITNAEDKLLPNKQIKKILLILSRLLNIADYNNLICKTRLEISRALELSPRTADRYISSFIRLGILRQAGHGKYMLNPMCVAKTGKEYRQGLLLIYNKESDEDDNNNDDIPF